ncbi:MAG TPA: transcriptional repressor LexA [Anaerolineae bacterium]|jgi:repressor LexA|nr:transcriptional repressor LexA [Anaerolineae bacterium]
MEILSTRQQAILDFIRSFSSSSKYPPTIREIGKAVSISSTSVVNYNLNILERKGLIERDRDVSRGIKLVGEAAAESLNTLRIPVLGRIAAGQPIPVPGSNFAILGDEMIEITRELLPTESKDIYALQVRGDSMVDAMIGDGDIVVMQHRQRADNGDLVAVWIKDKEATTLKRFYLEKGRVRLQPANPTMSPIYEDPKNVEVQGKVVLVIRRPN